MCKYNAEYLEKQLEQLEKQLEKEQDEEKRREIQAKIDAIQYVTWKYEDKIDHSDKLEPSGYCILHDPKAWKEKPQEVAAEFQKWLEKRERDPNTKEIIAIGFNLSKINLANHTFNKKITFTFTTFNQEANFGGATFTQRADFSETIFKQRAYFSIPGLIKGAAFKGEAYFNRATFKQGAYFSETAFTQSVYFSGASFEGEAYFNGATFKQGAYFSETAFKQGAYFDWIYVDGVLIFKNLRLLNIFRASREDSYVSLRRVRFGERGSSSGRIVIDACLIDRFSFINTDLSPSRIIIRNPKYSLRGKEILLADKQLLQAKQRYTKHKKLLEKYLETKRKLEKSQQNRKKARKKQQPENLKQKLNRIRLRLYAGLLAFTLHIHRAHKIPINELHYAENLTNECKNLRKQAEKSLGRPTQKKTKSIFDLDLEAAEKLIEDMDWIAEDFDLTLDNVLSVYRGLREHYDYMLRYEDSGRLFVGEMRLREQFAGWRGEKIFFKTYDLLAAYGESIWRPIIISDAIITLFSVLLNLEPAPGATPPDPVNLAQAAYQALARLPADPLGTLQSFLAWLKLRESVLTFLQMKSLENSGWITLTERLLAIPVFGSLIVALRRKLERRIRH